MPVPAAVQPAAAPERRVSAAPARVRQTVPVGQARAEAEPAAVVLAWAALGEPVPRAAAQPAGVVPAWAARRAEAVRLAVAPYLAAVVRPVDPGRIVVARRAGVALVAALAALAPGTGIRMKTGAECSARARPRLPVRGAEPAQADPGHAPLIAAVVMTPATAPETESRRTAVAAEG